MISQFLQQTLRGQNKVINFELPQKLSSIIPFKIDKTPTSKPELIKICQSIFEYQVKPYHPHFHNQLFGGFDQYSYMGAVLAPAINGIVSTYQISACFTLMENYLFEHMRKLIGWETIDATMTPGGSFANFMGLVLSRYRAFPETKKRGIYHSHNLKVFTSQVSHYSIKKGVILCGIGTDNIVYIKSDQNRRMIPSELQAAIVREKELGNSPIMVNSTVGTTVEGAIDPLTEIGDICKKHGVWHHVDAAFGGAFLMSEKLRPKLGSFENVDSITFDPHKGLIVPLQATFFFCKDPFIMKNCNAANADYLFHRERQSYGSELDVGDKTLQCGRVIDVFKLWTYFKGNGWQNVAKQVQSQYQLALYVKQYVKNRPDRFRLVVNQVDTFSICFWYIPASMKLSNFKSQEDFYQLLSKLTVVAKKYMIEQGKILIGYSKSKLPYYFWRPIMSNPFITTTDVEYEIQLIAKYCQMAYVQLTSSRKAAEHQKKPLQSSHLHSTQIDELTQSISKLACQKKQQSDKHPRFDPAFVSKIYQLALTFIQRTLKGQNKVIDFKLPNELSKAINLQISDDPCSQEELLKDCEAVLNIQAKAYHPHFHNQLYGGFDQHSFLGAVMAPSINGSVFTYEISACYTLMQNQVYEHLRQILEWQTMDATMVPGGSFANFMAVLMARHKLLPQTKLKGIYNQKPFKVFTSEVSHYSIKKGVWLQGIGCDNIILVKTDENRRMIPEQLEKQIQREVQHGSTLLMVNATLGTTVEGNIDPISQIGQICARYNIWLHVDGALGGGLLMSEKLKNKIGSFKHVDSVTFDPHKSLVVPQQATFFLCKHANLMYSCNATNADYLFHKQRASYTSSLDVGDKSLQCGRVIDIVKLWVYFKGNGWDKIARQVELEHELALHVKKYVEDRPNRFKLAVQETDTLNICFWYLPLKLKWSQFQNSNELYSLLSKVNVSAKHFMIQQGKILLGYSVSKSPYYFWRPVMSNPFCSLQQVDYDLEMLAQYCQKAYEHIMSKIS